MCNNGVALANDNTRNSYFEEPARAREAVKHIVKSIQDLVELGLERHSVSSFLGLSMVLFSFIAPCTFITGLDL